METGAGERIVAVVLAGGGDPGGLADGRQIAAKALVPLDGRPVVGYVLKALRHSASVASIVYLGPLEAGLDGIDCSLPAGHWLVDTLALGLGAALAQKPRRILVATADIPWITGAMVDRFVEAAPTADLIYPIVPERAARAQFPDQLRTFVRTSSGRFTGGNVLLLSPEVVPNLLTVADRVVRARKNPIALSALFGLDVIFGFLLGTIGVPRLERRASRILGYEARAMVTEDAALAADVDRPEHLSGGVWSRDRLRKGG